MDSMKQRKWGVGEEKRYERENREEVIKKKRERGEELRGKT